MAVLYHQGLVCLERHTASYDQEAQRYLDRCLAICQFNEPKRGDQGESARVKWQIARILERKGQSEDAEAYRTVALETKSHLQRTGHFQLIDDEEKSWDCFLALLYR